MNPDNVDAYEAVPMQCFACATRDAETRAAAEAKQGGTHADVAFDGLFVGVHPIEGRVT